jgi:DNA-directed RNA polymerase subunit RPC12/RpoP
MSDYRYAKDPAFDDNSEWVKCDTCEREYDRREYNSDTCDECENKLTIKEREGK